MLEGEGDRKIGQCFVQVLRVPEMSAETVHTATTRRPITVNRQSATSRWIDSNIALTTLSCRAPCVSLICLL